MTKQLSTYGAILLTIMVIIRAATMEHDKDLTNLYQRNTDMLYEKDNLVLRSDIASNMPSNTFLASNLKAISYNSFSIHPTLSTNNTIIVENVLRDISSIEIEEAFIAETIQDIEAVGTSEEIFSLDRENTINSSISLLFPRQKINPYPTSLQLQD